LLAVGNGTYALDAPEADLAELIGRGLIEKRLGGYVITEDGRRALDETIRAFSSQPGI
jgi:ribosomal protein S19E (S16A)